MTKLKFESPISTAKYNELVTGIDKAAASAKKYNVKTAFGTGFYRVSL